MQNAKHIANAQKTDADKLSRTQRIGCLGIAVLVAAIATGVTLSTCRDYDQRKLAEQSRIVQVEKASRATPKNADSLFMTGEITDHGAQSDLFFKISGLRVSDPSDAELKLADRVPASDAYRVISMGELHDFESVFCLAKKSPEARKWFEDHVGMTLEEFWAKYKAIQNRLTSWRGIARADAMACINQLNALRGMIPGVELLSDRALWGN